MESFKRKYRGQALPGRDKYTFIKHHIYRVLSEKKVLSSYNTFLQGSYKKIPAKIQLLCTCA